jgi:endonuclease/exonuclease/phosphatase family metal-dependent hydrolase
MPVWAMINRHTRIASLNARSIFKDADKNTQRLFLSYLKSSSLSLDLLCIQEVSSFHRQDHLTDEQCHYFRTFLFPQYPVVFTKYCAIICLNRNLILENAMVSLDERCIGVAVKDMVSNSLVCSILNVYGPAQRVDRFPFLENFMSSPLLSFAEGEVPCFLMGDLNLQVARLAESCQDLRFKAWYDWMSVTFSNCFPDARHTFQRGETQSTIDYMFGSISTMSRVSNCQQSYLPSSWTDHQLLCLDFLSDRKDVGPGFWRFNTTILQSETFTELLDDVVESFFLSAQDCNPQLSTQDLWERFKRAIKDIAETYSRGWKGQRRKELQRLQAKYQEFSNLPDGEASAQTVELANEISSKLDQEIETDMKQLLVRSATRWYEKGERNNRYFYKVLRTREAQQTLQAVVSHTTGDLVTSTADILQEAHHFYRDLYSPTSVDDSSIETLLSNVPTDALLSDAQVQSLDQVPTGSELIAVIKHAPNNKSPGLDGLPFEVYKYLFDRFPSVTALFTQILVDAFNGSIPPSWLQTRMVLLFKKGDPTLLSNWRPLSLINADAKIYTKLLANRFNIVLPSLINRYQTGFMPRRLISDNGWVNTTLMDNYRKSSLPLASSAVAVLLDQEKAYDRVHPIYLARVLAHFRFPNSIISSLNHLFFGTSISVSINGYLGAPLPQGRGLRQGDPLSPLLFNLAFEPLLRTLLACPLLPGVSLLPASSHASLIAIPRACTNPHTGTDDSLIDWQHPPVFKILSYADDLEVFLRTPEEWPVLQDLLSVYGAASNAKVNIHKTEIVSLSGKAHPVWQDISSSRGISYHTAASTHAVRYLGYPLHSSPSQLNLYLTRIKNVLYLKCCQLKSRGLSVRGLALITNSLVFSKLWHLLRVTPVPKYWLNDIRSMASKFLMAFRPHPSWNSICQPHLNGGLGVIDVHQQQSALNLVYIQRILKPKRATDFVTPMIGHCIQLYTGHRSFLPWLQYPEEYHKNFTVLPTMNILTALLKKLPPLLSDSEWSARWLADTPLKKALFSVVPDTARSGLTSSMVPFDIASIPIRYVVSDVVAWSYFYNGFSNFLRSDSSTRHRHGAPQEVLHVFQAADPPIQWMPLLQRFMPSDFNRDIPPPGYRTSPGSLSLSRDNSVRNRWVPRCSHWSIELNNKSFPVFSATPRVLRHYWLQQDRAPSGLRYRYFSNRIITPLVIPYGYCAPRVWRVFWSLSLPHQVITCWWRLLKNSVGTNGYFHSLSPTHWPSPICPICKTHTESTYHFFVSCSHKWSFWEAAIQKLQLEETLDSPESVWCILVSLHSITRHPVDRGILVQIGCIINVIWLSHWYCVFRNEEWSLSAALAMLSTRPSLSIIPDPPTTSE